MNPFIHPHTHVKYAVRSAENERSVTLNTCRDSCNPTKKKLNELYKFSRDPSRFVILCQWVTRTQSRTLLSSQFVVVTPSACCADCWKLFKCFIMTPKRPRCSLKKKKKKWNRLERIRRLGLGFPRSKPFKRTKHKSSSFDCPNFSSKSLFLAALIQPCVSPGWRQECGLAVVHECFMTMSARCYVTGWCGTPGCVTVAIIHLGLSVGGQGRRARTGNWFFQDALDFSWC